MRYARAVIFSMILILLSGCAGMMPAKVAVEDLTIERIVPAPGYSKEQIFNGTKIWIAENFSSAKSVIEHEDKEAGVFIGNGIISYPCYVGGMECRAKASWTVPFKMRVDIKDQRFRVTFTNVRISWPATYGQFASPAYDRLAEYQEELNLIKPVLLNFGDKILASFQKDKVKNDW